MLESVANWIINVISTLGYPGIFLTMTIESALIPLPSEIIMPFSGFLASSGQFSLVLVAFFGALGNTTGSLLSYGLGFWGHERVVRRFVRRFGKYLLFPEEELDKAELWMHKYKKTAVFGARLLPGVRTVISLAAGIVKLPLFNFVVLTFIGSFIWSYILAWFGYILGQNWKHLEVYFRKFELVIIGLIVLLVVYYIYSAFKKRKK